MEENNTRRIKIGNKEIILIGGSHLSKDSEDIVEDMIKKELPDRICIELCDYRYRKYKKMKTDKLYKSSFWFSLSLNLLYFSIEKLLNRNAGGEFFKAIEMSEKLDIKLENIDQDFRITSKRFWDNLTSPGKKFFIASIIFISILSIFKSNIIKDRANNVQDIDENFEKQLKESRNMPSYHNFIKTIYTILIKERNEFMVQNIKNCGGNKIVCVIGGGHLKGMQKLLEGD